LTYCIAWKTESAAFIIADSAVTQLVLDEKEQRVLNYTSFLENQGLVSKDKYVTESAYKIYSVMNLSIGMVGDASFATEFVEVLAQHLEVGRSLDQAIEFTIKNYMDFSNKPYIELIIATFDDKPILVSIKNRGSEFTSYCNDLVLLGSADENLENYTEGFYNSFKKSWVNESHLFDRDEMFFIRMIGLLQSYGIHNYTMEDGIGGTYSGVIIDQNGITPQLDTCFLISGENPGFETKKVASVLVENNCICIVNSDCPTICISNKVSKNSNESMENTVNNAREIFDRGKFKYIVLLNLSTHTACIVNMDYKLNHLLLSLDIRNDKKGTIGFIISSEIEDDLNDGYAVNNDTTIRYYPYIPINPKQLSYIDQNIEQLRVGKVINPVVEKYKYLIYESGNLVQWFYGNLDSIIPFFKHYQDKELLRAVDMSTDMVVAGQLVFPELDFPINEAFDNIPNKKRQENIHLFDIYPPDSEDILSMSVLASDSKEATIQAQATLEAEYGESYGFLYVGMRFYHPAFYWSKETYKAFKTELKQWVRFCFATHYNPLF
jgi:hypothetical protein